MTAAITIKKAAEVYRAELPASPFFQLAANLAGLKKQHSKLQKPDLGSIDICYPS
jgi:hypothetical protein